MPEEQRALEMVLVTALQAPSLWDAPAPTFVADLERDLMAAARRRQVWQVLGAVGGGVLSVVGGALVWYWWRRQRLPATPSRAAPAQARGIGLWRRQPA